MFAPRTGPPTHGVRDASAQAQAPQLLESQAALHRGVREVEGRHGEVLVRKDVAKVLGQNLWFLLKLNN